MRSLNVDFQESNQIRNSRQVRAVEEWNDITPESGDTGLSGRDVVLAHVTSSLLEVDDFTNEMVLNSSYKNSPLRMNIYPGREEAVLTINCARLLSMDNLASNARVHTVDRVLEPVTQSVVDILSQPQFSQFKQFLEQEDLIETLTNATGVTVFAPNNDAWDKLGDGLRDKYSRGEACIDSKLIYHSNIFSSLVCTLTSNDTTGITVFAPNNDARDKLGVVLRDNYSRGEACIDSKHTYHSNIFSSLFFFLRWGIGVDSQILTR
ncbi:hypothetical protein J6590_024449 [Homalodisca vitripennis]|nr:hypothetical protein J6590_024449 [Homalodisca vitripennis]